MLRPIHSLPARPLVAQRGHVGARPQLLHPSGSGPRRSEAVAHAADRTGSSLTRRPARPRDRPRLPGDPRVCAQQHDRHRLPAARPRSISDDDVDAFSRRHGLTPGRTALFLGGVDKAKGIDFLFESAQRPRRRCRASSCWWVVPAPSSATSKRPSAQEPRCAPWAGWRAGQGAGAEVGRCAEAKLYRTGRSRLTGVWGSDRDQRQRNPRPRGRLPRGWRHVDLAWPQAEASDTPTPS